MISKISRYYDSRSMPNQVLKEGLEGKVELTGEELEKHPNLVITATCKCGFPLQVDLKKDGKLMITPGKDIEIECFLCKRIHTIKGYERDI